MERYRTVVESYRIDTIYLLSRHRALSRLMVERDKFRRHADTKEANRHDIRLNEIFYKYERNFHVRDIP